MSIGVKETQEIIRQAAVLSRNEPAVPVKLDPREVGMATGPRHRKRALLRAGPVPDYLDPAESAPDEWQKLDDDIYKFLQLRKDQFGRMAAPPSQQFIAEMEAQLRLADPGYELGSFLGLMRQAADLDQTRQTYVTASEKNTFHAFARRLTEGRRAGESFDPGMVKRYRELLETNHPTTNRGLADLFRLVSRAARLPLIGSLREAPSLSVGVLLQVVDLSARFNQNTRGSLEFQVGPMDVFLGARTVLFNRSVANPTLSMVKELVLDETGLYHDDLIELLRNVGVFGSELTLLMPESLTEEGFALQGGTYSAVELVMAAGARMAKSQASAERAMATIADAIVHKVQQQDSHKDGQIQSILSHFNRLLQGERRSAARVTEERQQARFDYMAAIRTASRLAKGMQSGQLPAMQAGPDGAVPIPAPRIAARLPESLSQAGAALPAAPIPAPAIAPSYPEVPAPSSPMPSAVLLGRISVGEYDSMLGGWDLLLGRLRKKLTTKSPTFKSLVSQLAKVRSLDNCLAYGLTPAGGRSTSRLGKLIQGDDLRARLGIPESVAESLEDAFSMEYPGFLASMESLIASVYGFRPVLQTLQFRLRDRLPARMGPGAGPEAAARMADRRAESADSFEAALWADPGELDEVALRLLLGCMILAMEMAGGPAVVGDGDPFLAYCTLLWAARRTLGTASPEDLEANLMLLIRLTPDERNAMHGKYREWIGAGNRPAPLVPGLGATPVREGWLRGFERGFMAEVGALYNETEGSVLESRLLELLASIQADLDTAAGILEGEKLRLTRERVSRFAE